MNRLKEMLNPNSEYSKRQKEKMLEIVELAYKEECCCTCKNYIPIDDTLPAFVSTYPECKLGGLAINHCKNYICDR